MPGGSTGRDGTGKKKLSEDSDRIRWTVLRAFGRLPTDEAARQMGEGDFLYCYLNLLLDEEQGAGWESGFNTGFYRTIETDAFEREGL